MCDVYGDVTAVMLSLSHVTMSRCHGRNKTPDTRQRISSSWSLVVSLQTGALLLPVSLSANHRHVSRSHDHSQPIRGQVSLVSLLTPTFSNQPPGNLEV